MTALPPATYLSAHSLDALPWPAGHRLAIPRLPLTQRLAEALGWLSAADCVPARQASAAELLRFHTPDYVAAVLRAEASGDLPAAEAMRHRLATPSLRAALFSPASRASVLPENPVFPGMVARHATAAGAGLQAAQLLLAGPAAVLAPVGGSHHARRDSARGYCYFNDIALGIQALLDGGMRRVLYVDLDAHHGDAVEDAFRRDPRVLTISVHRRGNWESGDDVRPPGSLGALNLPLPAQASDAELLYALKHAVLPAARDFRPEAVVLLSGADALHDDPVGGLGYSARGLWLAARELLGLADRQLVLGGGGYNPLAAARLWTGLWGLLRGEDPASAALTPAAQAALAQPPGPLSPDALRLGPIRPEAARTVAEAARALPGLFQLSPPAFAAPRLRAPQP